MRRAKVCTKCGEEKPFDEFYPQRRGKFGRAARCASCSRAASREWKRANVERARHSHRKWVAENPDRAREINRRWAAGAKEKRREGHRKWQQKNREKVRARNSEWNKRNRDTLRAAYRRWAAKNPIAIRARNIRRRTREREIGNPSKAAILALYQEQAGRCALCGDVLDRYQVDHVIPVALGGRSLKINLQLLCSPCNGWKGAKSPDEVQMALADYLAFRRNVGARSA